MEKKSGLVHGFLHIFYAVNYSLQGIGTGLKSSLAIKQEFFILALLAGLGWYTGKDWKMLGASLSVWTIVIVAELFNSAIEEALDLITREYSKKVKAAKDMGSAAVFLLILINFFVQGIIYQQEIMQGFAYLKQLVAPAI